MAGSGRFRRDSRDEEVTCGYLVEPAVGRRTFLGSLGVAAASCLFPGSCATPVPGSRAQASLFQTRGVVLIPEDFTLRDWPERSARAGLTTLAIHHQNSPAAVVDFVKSEAGQSVLERCRTLGLQVEYELHAMKELLPRNRFSRNPEFFRMDEAGNRVADHNCCVHSPGALEILAENAVALAGQLRPTTGRYFLWGDDGQPWCRCPDCGSLSDSEQALVVENQLVSSLRKVDPQATLAHLAYHNTLEPPRQVKPDPAIFLEYAPIRRHYDRPYHEQAGADAPDGLSALKRNLAVFPARSAQVLEYWLDVSRFSGWNRPARKLPWKLEVFREDLRTYGELGIRHVTSFAAWLDAGYLEVFGEFEFLSEYGKELLETNL